MWYVTYYITYYDTYSDMISFNFCDILIGADLIEWVQQNANCIDQIEAIHLCHMVSAHGYIFPIDDHILTVKNDGTYCRFQTKCFWLSRCHEPDNTDYGE